MRDSHLVGTTNFKDFIQLQLFVEFGMVRSTDGVHKGLLEIIVQKAATSPHASEAREMHRSDSH